MQDSGMSVVFLCCRFSQTFIQITWRLKWYRCDPVDNAIHMTDDHVQRRIGSPEEVALDQGRVRVRTMQEDTFAVGHVWKVGYCICLLGHFNSLCHWFCWDDVQFLVRGRFQLNFGGFHFHSFCLFTCRIFLLQNWFPYFYFKKKTLNLFLFEIASVWHLNLTLWIKLMTLMITSHRYSKLLKLSA